MRPLYWKYFQWRKCNFFCKENVDLNLTLVQKKPQFKNCVLHLTSALHKERSRSPFHNTALHSTTTISHQQSTIWRHHNKSQWKPFNIQRVDTVYDYDCTTSLLGHTADSVKWVEVMDIMMQSVHTILVHGQPWAATI